MSIPLSYALFYCDMIRAPENLHAVIKDEPLELISLSAETQFKKPRYCVILDHGHFSVVVAISSTSDINDAFTDVCAVAKNASFFGIDGKVHDGFYSAAQEIFLHARESIFTLAHIFDYSITVIGHSLGGATATILAMLLKDYATTPEIVSENENGTYRISGIAFGAPPSISEDLSMKTLDFIKTYVLEKDPVPHCWRLIKKVSESKLLKLTGGTVQGIAAILSDLLLNNDYCLGGEVHFLKSEACGKIVTTNGKEFNTFSLPMDTTNVKECIEEHVLTSYISKFGA